MGTTPRSGTVYVDWPGLVPPAEIEPDESAIAIYSHMRPVPGLLRRPWRAELTAQHIAATE